VLVQDILSLTPNNQWEISETNDGYMYKNFVFSTVDSTAGESIVHRSHLSIPYSTWSGRKDACSSTSGEDRTIEDLGTIKVIYYRAIDVLDVLDVLGVLETRSAKGIKYRVDSWEQPWKLHAVSWVLTFLWHFSDHAMQSKRCRTDDKWRQGKISICPYRQRWQKTLASELRVSGASQVERKMDQRFS
jgi:hypothetical protein